MKLLKAIRKFFLGPTVEEAYQDGAELARSAIEASDGDEAVAENLYAYAVGSFNETENHRAFDRGVRDQLKKMGFEQPY